MYQRKQQILRELLEQGKVLIALDARHQKVDVPAHLKNDIQLRLNLSYRFEGPLLLEEEVIHATLRFSGQPYPCKIPWEAVFLAVSYVSGQPYLFSEAIPTELRGNTDLFADPLLASLLSAAEKTTAATPLPQAIKPQLRLYSEEEEKTEKANKKQTMANTAPTKTKTTKKKKSSSPTDKLDKEKTNSNQAKDTLQPAATKEQTPDKPTHRNHLRVIK